MNVLSNFVLRGVFDNLIHSNYAFSAKLQFHKKVLVTQVNMACSSIINIISSKSFISLLYSIYKRSCNDNNNNNDN